MAEYGNFSWMAFDESEVRDKIAADYASVKEILAREGVALGEMSLVACPKLWPGRVARYYGWTANG